MLSACGELGLAVRDGGTYGHVDGPRFNTPTEIAQLAGCRVVAVSQTGGPETVLCGELELPYALIGFATDYANEVQPGKPTPVATLVELMGRSSAMFAFITGSIRFGQITFSTPLHSIRGRENGSWMIFPLASNGS